MADRRLVRRAGTLALLLAIVLCVAGIFQHGLWTPDEPREAEVGREMLESGFSSVPTLGGEPFLEKPPLHAWITAASYAAFGVNAGAARIPAALFSIGACWVAYLLGTRAAGRVAGLCSSIALVTMWQFSETSHKAVLDTALTFFVAAGHLAFLRLRPVRRPVRNQETSSHFRTEVGGSLLVPYVAIGVTSGLAFLTKSWIGPALLCAPPILAAAAMRNWPYVKRVLPRAFVASALGVAAFGLPWVLAVAGAPNGGWAAVKESLWTEYVGRSTGGGGEFRKSGHSNPPWYYLTVALYVAVPWTLAVPAMVKGRTLSRTWRGGGALWCGLVFVAGVLLLSIPSGKRDLYLVPLLPAAAVPVGVWLSRVDSRRGGAWDVATARSLAGLAWIVLTLLVLAVAYVGFGGQRPSFVPEETWSSLAEGLHPFAQGAFWVGLPALIAAVYVRRIRRVVLPPSARACWAMVVLFALLHAAVRPLLDPSRDMEEGARAAVALVPRDEPLVAFSADETSIAVLSYYSARKVVNLEQAKQLADVLDHGPGRHLVVMDKDVRKLERWSSRLSLVATVRLSATRELNVYAVNR